MSLLDLIGQRRSIRKYLSKPIPKADLLKCVEAARLAPSACNSQPWKFILVDDPELKTQVCQEIFSGIYSMNQFAKEAGALVVVVSEKGRFLSGLGGQIRDTRYFLVDIGIACEHLVLQAEELGLGSCWIGWFDERKLKKRLNIPKGKKVDIVITLGYSDPERPAPRPRKTLEEISSFNTYA